MDVLLYYTVPSLILILILFFLQKKQLRFRRYIMIGFLICQTTYLVFRVLYTFPSGNVLDLVAATSLYLAEFSGYLQTLILVVLFWTPYKRPDKSLAALETLPTVDVLIATYNEGPDVLGPTLIGALNLDYPKDKLNIYLCDDGNRPEIKKLAETHGVGYLSRSSNADAKAGNLNNALKFTTSEIIVTQDADMVPKVNFLQETLGHFANPKIAFVQTPQTFYNMDIFQHNLYLDYKVNNEQDFFMRVLQQAKDRFNAIIYIGSNALFRRTALEDIGGFATGVITEDMATGLKLQNKKWQSAYVNKALASGLSPETLADYLKQRDRWGRGNVQVMKKYPLHTLKNLSWIQKILYWDGIMYWFSGFRTIFYMIGPTLYFLFGIASLRTDFLSLIAFWVPSYLSSLFLFKSLSTSKFSIFMSSVYEIISAPQVAIAVLKELLFGGVSSNKFHVTVKGISSQKSYFDWRNCRPQLLLLSLNLVTLGVLVYKVSLGVYTSSQLFSLNLLWFCYNLIVLSLAIPVAYERPRLPFFLNLREEAELSAGVEVLPVNLTGMTTTNVIIKVPNEKLAAVTALLEVNQARISFLNIKNVRISLATYLRGKKETKILLQRESINYLNYYNWLCQLFSNQKVPVGELVHNQESILSSYKKNKTIAAERLRLFK